RPTRRRQRSALSPYTTLFRSADDIAEAAGAAGVHAGEGVLEHGGAGRLDAQFAGGGEEGVGARLAGQAAFGGDHTVDPDVEQLLDRKSTRLNSSHVKRSYAVF